MPGPMDCEGPSPRSKPAGHIGIKSAILAPRGVRCPILTICWSGHDLGRSRNISQLRKAREDAPQPGAALEDADLWPVLLLIDSERRQVPRLIMDRVLGAEAASCRRLQLADVEASLLLPAWQKARFRTCQP